MKKRLSLLSYLLVLAMAVMAQTKVEVDGIYYNLDSSNNTAEVTSGDSKYRKDIVIPASISVNGSTYSVTTIGERAFLECTYLTSIEIPNSITTIEEGAFYGCVRLTSIEIPNSVTTIGEFAFFECTYLTSIEIPNSVTSIGNSAFRNCTGLTSIIVATDNPIYDSRNNCNAIIDKVSNTLIQGCKITIIPNSVTTIGEFAFCNYTGLTSIEIPNSVTSIGNSAFEHCTGLTSIEIPNTVTDIGVSAFSRCN